MLTSEPNPVELPPELLESLSKGECVLFAGAGLSARAGLPTRRDLLAKLLEVAVSALGRTKPVMTEPIFL
jgi:NAD-dependent SIR2 family protein deacetylase